MKKVAYLVALAALILAGCSGGGGFSKRAQEGKENVLRYPIPKLTTIDPAKVSDGDTIDALQQVYETLTQWGEDNTVKPNLAESWTISDDGRTYTFKLKPGVKFFSGREVTAADVKWSIERACNPKLQSSTAPVYLGEIVGVKEMLDGKATEISGIKVIDDKTLTITIDKPRPYWLGKFTFLVAAVVDKDKVPADAEMTSVDQMVGTGPFKAERYEPTQILVLAANKDYHAGAPKIDKIERPEMGDATARLNKFRSGELDLVNLERADIAGIQADPKLKDQLKFYDRPAIWYIGLNTKLYKPFSDRRVRRAFAMAINRETLVTDVLGGINKRADSIIPPGIPGHRDKAAVLPYDVAAAKALLAEAGFPNGRGLPKLEMYFREGRPDIQRVAEAVASQLKENLGVTVDTRPMEWRAYLERHNRKDLPFYHMRWGADYLDPENFLSLHLSTNGAENKMEYSNPQFDALTAEADVLIGNEPRRQQLYAQAEDIALQDAIWIPVYFQRDAELQNPRVSGLRESLFGHLPHTQVTLRNP